MVDFQLVALTAIMEAVAGAFLDFLSVRILKLCSLYFDFQKIERKKSKRALF